MFYLKKMINVVAYGVLLYLLIVILVLAEPESVKAVWVGAIPIPGID